MVVLSLSLKYQSFHKAIGCQATQRQPPARRLRQGTKRPHRPVDSYLPLLCSSALHRLFPATHHAQPTVLPPRLTLQEIRVLPQAILTPAGYNFTQTIQCPRTACEKHTDVSPAPCLYNALPRAANTSIPPSSRQASAKSLASSKNEHAPFNSQESKWLSQPPPLLVLGPP